MLKKQLLMGMLCLGILGLAGCGTATRLGRGGSYSHAVDILSIGVQWVSITPFGTIVGLNTLRVADSGHDFEGVFIKDRNVTLSPYSLAKHELTYAQWKQVYDWAVNNNYTFRTAPPTIGGIGSNGTGNPDEQPVTCVTWRDSIVWCNAYTEMAYGNDAQCVYRDSSDNVLRDSNQVIEALVSTANMVDKKGYRLPTEAEWEYAARWQGTDSTNALDYGGVYLTAPDSFSGATQNYVNDYANNACGWSDNNSGGKTHNVGQKQANALGLYDMSGNVWEWCFDEAENASVPTGNYTNPIVHHGVPNGNRILHGGSYSNANYSKYCVVSYGGGIVPNTDSQWEPNKEKIGFRVAYSQ